MLTPPATANPNPTNKKNIRKIKPTHPFPHKIRKPVHYHTYEQGGQTMP